MPTAATARRLSLTVPTFFEDWRVSCAGFARHWRRERGPFTTGRGGVCDVDSCQSTGTGHDGYGRIHRHRARWLRSESIGTGHDGYGRESSGTGHDGQGRNPIPTLFEAPRTTARHTRPVPR